MIMVLHVVYYMAIIIMLITTTGGVLRGQRGCSIQRGGAHSEALQGTHRGYRKHLCSSSGLDTLESKVPLDPDDAFLKIQRQSNIQRTQNLCVG